MSHWNCKDCFIFTLPVELIIKIYEFLEIIDAKSFAEALKMPFTFATQYHAYSDKHEYCHYFFSDDSSATDLYKSFFLNKTFQKAVHGNKKMFIAIGTRDMDIIKSTLNDPQIDHYEYDNPLTSACMLGVMDCVKFLLSDYKLDPSVCRNGAIIAAAMGGHGEIVELLLKDTRTDPSDQENEAIKAAVHNGWEDVVKILLSDSRVDVSVLKKIKNDE